MMNDIVFEDVVAEVAEELRVKLRKAEAKGCRRFYADPGFGFGKRLEDNLVMLKRLPDFHVLWQVPLFVGLSRKRMIGDLTGKPVGARLAGSLAAATLAALAGAAVVRAHDVGETVDAMRIVDAVVKVGDNPDDERGNGFHSLTTERKLFGTDGIRGVANQAPMTAAMALRLGQAVAQRFKHPERRGRIVIGKDTRLSGYMLESALQAGIVSAGADVLLVGPMPTPAIAFLTTSMRADAGLVLSASHNPYADNGIKIFAGDGFKLPDEIETAIEVEMAKIEQEGPSGLPTGDGIGKARRIDDAPGRYMQAVKQSFPKSATLDGIKIVIDCANGAAYQIAPTVFAELGADVVPMGVSPDGKNINDGCGALFPDKLAKAVLAHQADIGIALDGDADRLILVDEKGNVVDGDRIMAMVALRLKAKGQLPKDTVVATVMSNLGLERALDQYGIRLLRTKVGDRYVVETLRKEGMVFGGEQSGHLVFLDHGTTGDGVLAALQVLSVVVQEGKPLSELAAVMNRYPQVLINFRVREKPPIESMPDVVAAIAAVEKRLGKEGRVLVRYSGTEPKARVMVEGLDQDEITNEAERIVDAFKSTVGA